MRKFLDINRFPSSPKSFPFVVMVNGERKERRVHWLNGMDFGMFYRAVSDFASSNNLPVPSFEETEDHVCGQVGSGWCTGNPLHQRPAPAPRKPGGCKACGRR
jgi:hypothetical protein